MDEYHIEFPGVIQVEYFFDLVTGLWQTQKPVEMDVLRPPINN